MKHRIAILSDIHGDTTALEAVIADARALGATEYWLLGDILLPGPGREDLFELLDAIPITAAVRGNWDDCVLEALDGEYGLGGSAGDPTSSPHSVSHGRTRS